jgi:hypothetical protein
MEKIRQWLLMNSALLTVVAILITVLSMASLLWNSRGAGSSQALRSYYYDLGSEKPEGLDRLFPGERSAIAPIASPSGKQGENGELMGVRAMVYSCGECTDRSSLFIGYLETLTPPARLAMEKLREAAGGPPNLQMMATAESGTLVRSLEGKDQWYPRRSPEGMTIVNAARSHCGEDNPPQPCYP